MADAPKYAAAMRVLIAKDFLKSEAHEKQHWRANREGAHAGILTFEKKFISRMAKLNVPMYAHTVVRGRAAQAEAYVKGTSKARFGESPHNFGLAVDIVHGTQHWNIPPDAWTLIGHIGKEVAAQNGLKLEWGGDWEFYDPAHWELKNWRRIKESF